MRKRLNKVWSKRHLPEELWPEILSRLPVKSLLRFRCVSKQWLSMIGNREFCRLHLKNFKNNRDETHLFVVQGRRYDCDVRRSDTFETTSNFLCVKAKVLCSIDGLVLIRGREEDLSGSRHLILWNPSIKKFYCIPPVPKIEIPSNSDNDLNDLGHSILGLTYFRHTEIGLGYDPLIDDYKLVKLIFLKPSGSYEDILHSVAVYTLGAGKWKIIPFQCKGYSEWQWEPEFDDMKAVYFKGGLYFIGFSEAGSFSDLVCFDLGSEVFSTITPPAECHHCFGRNKGYQVVLVDGGCSLAVSDFKSIMCVLENPIGEGEPMCWSTRYEFQLAETDILYVKKNNDVLMQWRGQEVYLYLANGDEKVKQRYDLVMTYNLDTKKQKILMQKKGGALWIHYVCPYVESLILLKSLSTTLVFPA